MHHNTPDHCGDARDYHEGAEDTESRFVFTSELTKVGYHHTMPPF